MRAGTYKRNWADKSIELITLKLGLFFWKKSIKNKKNVCIENFINVQTENLNPNVSM